MHSGMRHAYQVGALMLLSACTSTPQVAVDTQTVRDYAEVGELEDVQHIRVFNHDSWSYLSEYFIIYKSRDRQYLVEFRRRCRELRDNTLITGDRRYNHNRMHVKEDTIRGCRLAKIYLSRKHRPPS